ncbi:sulfite oxidase [Neptuniibacter sp. CAU 1671]|uniref:SorT family sulfite dehydrogenase catalytic subunit n=1 Tax=Neptuniibacter sp. CAU 1671 TaxID=3032593 RepID=UPI0023DB84AE|nr:sulfite oxidase [Neptuniibacter sp. CAU 1671]MDF2182662.1 sulfite oxidase [Neptuniibacter sp. CAU 1671]
MKTTSINSTLSDDGLGNPQRRKVLLGSAGAFAALSLAPFSPVIRAEDKLALPDYAAWKEADAVIVHSKKTIETKRDAIGSGGITSSDRLYVRNNLPQPDAAVMDNPDAWQVSIAGVKNPTTLSVAELKTIGVETVVAVLQCSGNGRAFFKHGPGGTQWGTGAAGCVAWTGVPLRDVVEKLGGYTEGMQYITSTGGETLPDGIDPKTVVVERSVPLRALDHAILAWEMNDESLPLAHGGPLRIVIPGYFGVNNVKYVKQIAFTEQQTSAKIQASGYRLRAVGQKGAPDQPSMWEMPVKSWITTPINSSKAGVNMIYGVAFGGTVPLKSIELSFDGGKNWQPGRFLGADMGPYAWRPFVFTADLKPGTYQIVSRATDINGATQPENRTDNERGYGNNSWSDHGISLQVT